MRFGSADVGRDSDAQAMSSGGRGGTTSFCDIPDDEKHRAAFLSLKGHACCDHVIVNKTP